MGWAAEPATSQALGYYRAVMGAVMAQADLQGRLPIVRFWGEADIGRQRPSYPDASARSKHGEVARSRRITGQHLRLQR